MNRLKHGAGIIEKAMRNLLKMVNYKGLRNQTKCCRVSRVATRLALPGALTIREAICPQRVEAAVMVDF